MKKKIIIVLLTIVGMVLFASLSMFIDYRIKVRKDHQLLFTLRSDGGMYCGYVYLNVYDDNTYEYVHNMSMIIGKKNVGTYKYNVTVEKLMDAEKFNSKSNYFIAIIDNNDNEYYIGNENSELKKFLNSIFLHKRRVSLGNMCS